jgi:thiol-disulfide isomerase/thioredoxin
MTQPISNHHQSPKSRPALLSAITSIFFIAFTLLFSGVRAEAQAKVGKPPKESVANRQIRTLDGKQFTIAGLRGQVVVLDFFAIWCGHSKKHIPTLTRFGDEERQQGLQIIGLAVQDNESTPERITQFIKEFNIAYPVGTVQDAEFSGYVQSRDVSVPQTLVYGRDGRLVAHFAGHDSKIDADLTATIKRELAKQ